MNWRRRYLIAAGAILAISAGGVGIAVATGGGGGDDDGDATVSGPAAEQATAAALKITHGGTANSVERDGENGATWEVEVTKPDGNTVDVRLDQSYNLVVTEGDGGESEQTDSSEPAESAGDADGSQQAEASEGAEANDANEARDANDANEPGDANDANEQGEDGN